MERKNTHANKAESYDIGRPCYPNEFYEYLYGQWGLTKNTVIADMGAGTGKVTKGFLERGNRVYAVEPDKDMMRRLKNNLANFPDCIHIESTAENTEIPAASIDIIFCGNSYHWFDKGMVIPEFKRVLRNAGSKFNIVITSLGQWMADMASPFENGKYIEKTFEYTVYNELHEYLHGNLSASWAPTPEDDNFHEYCESLKQSFDENSIDGKIEVRFKLFCMIGNVENLIL